MNQQKSIGVICIFTILIFLFLLSSCAFPPSRYIENKAYIFSSPKYQTDKIDPVVTPIKLCIKNELMIYDEPKDIVVDLSSRCIYLNDFIIVQEDEADIVVEISETKHNIGHMLPIPLVLLWGLMYEYDIHTFTATFTEGNIKLTKKYKTVQRWVYDYRDEIYEENLYNGIVNKLAEDINNFATNKPF